MRSEKIIFSALLQCKIQFRPCYDFKLFKFFFQKIIFLTVLTPYTAQVRKVNSAKNHILVIFYSAKSISDHITISELFQVFSKNQFFSLFRTLYCKAEKHEVRKNHFSALLQCKIHFRPIYKLRIFSIFFSKHQFFLLFRTLYCKGEKHEVRKNHFSALLQFKIHFRPIYDLRTFSFFLKNINFFHCFEPYTAKVRSMRSEKNHFQCSFIVQNPIQTRLRF